MSPFLILPLELYLIIMSYLEAADDLAYLMLPYTCRFLHELLPAANHETLLRLELTPLAMKREMYACRFCHKLRHKSKFADNIFKKRNGKACGSRSKFGSARHKRFCGDCGFNRRDRKGYGLGARVTINGVEKVWCKKSKKVKEDVYVGFSRGSKLKTICAKCEQSLEYNEYDRLISR
jgi:hypothetical protein